MVIAITAVAIADAATHASAGDDDDAMGDKVTFPGSTLCGVTVIVQSAGDPAPWAAGGAAVGALIGGCVAYIATRRQVSAMEAEGERQRAATASEREADRTHELALSREERAQQRKQDAYVHLMSYAVWATEYAQFMWVDLQVKMDPSHRKTGFPEIDDSVRSLAVLMSSEAVGEQLSTLTNQLFAFGSAANRFEAAGPTAVSLDILTAERDVVMATASTLRNMLREELGVTDP